MATCTMVNHDAPEPKPEVKDLDAAWFFLLANKPTRVVLPGGQGAVYIRVMNGDERMTWETESEAAAKAEREDGRSPALVAVLRLLVATVCDADGKPLFCLGDIPTLAAKPAPLLLFLAGQAKRLNALSTEDIDALEKN